MNHRYKLASVFLSASLVMAACGGNEDITEDMGDDISEDDSVEETEVDEIVDEDEDTTSTDTPEEGSSDDASTSDSDSIASLEDIPHDASEAVAVAAEDFEGELKELEFDNEDGQWVYKVEMESESEEYEATLSSDDLSIIEAETDSDDGFDTEEHIDYDSVVAAEEAVQTAMDESGGELEGWTLSTDDGQPEYEIDLTGGDVTVDARTGEILETDD